MIVIDPNKCVKCGLCREDCVAEIIRQEDGAYPSVAPADEASCLNCQHCLAICPAGAVSCNGVGPGSCQPIGALPEYGAVPNLLRARRSIRRFKSESLDPATLAKLAAALSWSPTGCNDHRLRFVVVEDKAALDSFRAEIEQWVRHSLLLRSAGKLHHRLGGVFDAVLAGQDVFFRGAPHIIVAAAPKDSPCAAADPWIALSQFEILAATLGVGTCWDGLAEILFKLNAKLRARLDLPSGYKIGAVLMFGLPAVRYARATNPPPSVISPAR
jgi:nitroreductase/NAD-dependent dihydropyrimidine dehydrogenase PreA subunit